MFFKYFSRQISFSRTFQGSPVYSSTFQACANPDDFMQGLSVNVNLGADLQELDVIFFFYICIPFCLQKGRTVSDKGT